MPITRIDEFPAGDATLTGDDIFLIMDDPSGSGITKRVSLTTLNSLISGGGLPLSVPESNSLVTTVFNKTGSQIQKFKAVYINGGQGDQATINLAIASGEGGSSKTYGITAENINHMGTGKVVVFGALSGLNTDQFNPSAPTGDVNGTILYLSPSISGGITTTKPSAPDHLVSLGTIVRTHQNAGVVEVRVQNGFELEELHNVQISGVSNKQAVVYDSSSGLWKNTSLTNSHISDLGTNTVLSLGAVSGTNAINYGLDRLIQTLTLNGTATTFTKGTGWPSSSTSSSDTILKITASSATTITWSIVTDWFNQPAAGALTTGTHLFLLRSVGSGVMEGHYIGNKTN